MAKVTELISDGTRTQIQAVSFQDVSLESQSSPQTKVRAAIPIGSRNSTFIIKGQGHEDLQCS